MHCRIQGRYMRLFDDGGDDQVHGSLHCQVAEEEQ